MRRNKSSEGEGGAHQDEYMIASKERPALKTGAGIQLRWTCQEFRVNG